MDPEAHRLPQHADILETALHGNHPADVLARLYGDGFNLPEYTITPGGEPDSRRVSLVLPRSVALPRLPWYRPPEAVLSASRGIEAVRDIVHSARHHMFMILNGHHAEARLLTHVIMGLGGTVKRGKDGITLRITSDVSVIDQLYAFIRGMPGLVQKVRINPVFESVTARDELDDLVPQGHSDGKANGEERTLRITGDARGAPDIAVLQHLAEEKRRVELVSLSRRELLPDSTQFEMIVILRSNDPNVWHSLPAALVSGHVGIYGAQPIAPEQALQYVQIVPGDDYDAKDLVRSQGGILRVQGKRWPDRRPVVTGSVPLMRVPRLRGELEEAHVPHAVNVPIVPGAPMYRPLAGKGVDLAGADYRWSMRQLLTALLPDVES